MSFLLYLRNTASVFVSFLINSRNTASVLRIPVSYERGTPVAVSWYRGYLAHKKPPSLRTLQSAYAKGLMVVIWGLSNTHRQPCSRKALPSRRPTLSLFQTTVEGYEPFCEQGPHVSYRSDDGWRCPRSEVPQTLSMTLWASTLTRSWLRARGSGGRRISALGATRGVTGPRELRRSRYARMSVHDGDP